MTATGRVLMRGVRLAVLVTALGSAIAPTGAHVRVFVGGAFGPVVPYPYYAPYPYPYYYGPYPYPYAPGYAVPPPGWDPGHWESRRDAWGRAIWVWVPGHLR